MTPTRVRAPMGSAVVALMLSACAMSSSGTEPIPTVGAPTAAASTAATATASPAVSVAPVPPAEPADAPQDLVAAFEGDWTAVENDGGRPHDGCVWSYGGWLCGAAVTAPNPGSDPPQPGSVRLACGVDGCDVTVARGETVWRGRTGATGDEGPVRIELEVAGCEVGGSVELEYDDARLVAIQATPCPVETEGSWVFRGTRSR